MGRPRKSTLRTFSQHQPRKLFMFSLLLRPQAFSLTNIKEELISMIKLSLQESRIKLAFNTRCCKQKRQLHMPLVEFYLDKYKSRIPLKTWYIVNGLPENEICNQLKSNPICMTIKHSIRYRLLSCWIISSFCHRPSEL